MPESPSHQLDLIIFDVDGTLAETYSLELLPGVEAFFRLLKEADCPHKPQIAIATNQGGVGMRYWMERSSFGKPHEYPTQADIEHRLEKLVEKLGLEQPVPVYVSYRYQTRQGHWAPVPPAQKSNLRWQQSWRKPQPGMLLQAIEDAGVPPERSMYVGDSPEDQQAAQAAGAHFSWASDFFARVWLEGDELCQEG